ncbi:MAG: propionate catabolism operon transcriptional regulator [Paraglaciecola sp.]|jgi:propionate catabolism operon transcriptional regulator
MRTTNSQPVRVLVFGHKEFSQLVSSVIPRFAGRAMFQIVDAIVGSVSEVKEHVAAYEPDIIVSGGANAHYLKSCIEIPVVSVDVTAVDVLQAIKRASKVSKKIVLIHFKDSSELLPMYEKALNVEIHEEIYNRTDEAREIFHMVSKQPDIAIVGASLVCGLAAQRNLPAFMFYSAPSCAIALEKAIYQGTQFRANKTDAALIDWLLKQSKTPIIMTDGRGDSITLNVAAKRDLNLSTDVEIDLADLIHPQQNKRPTDGECIINGQDWWFHQDEVTTFGRCMFIYQLYRKNLHMERPERTINAKNKLVFRSEAIATVMSQVKSFASSPSNILIQGESGTGKELIAREIYDKGPFSKGKFVALNCSAIPSELFEGELFGHQDGAFTGAKRGGRKGLIEEAQNGVLFLDEISELALDQQAKLLRFLQERMYRPLGGNIEKSVNLKLVAASNKDLRQMVEHGEFREDLFFRLNVFNISIPPLRERTSDILCIAEIKLQKLVEDYGLSVSVDAILSQITNIISEYHWPGNVRELENILERVIAHLHMDKDLNGLNQAIKHIAPELSVNRLRDRQHGRIKDNELAQVAQAMEKFSGNKQVVAEYLGLSQTTLWRRLKNINN